MNLDHTLSDPPKWYCNSFQWPSPKFANYQNSNSFIPTELTLNFLN